MQINKNYELTATFFHHPLFGQRRRFIYRLKFNFVFCASWRNSHAPRTLTLLIRDLFFGDYLDDIATN